jgi:hypothetical protein
MITPGGRRAELSNIGGKKVVEDWVTTGVRGTKMAMSTGIGGCDGN